jgi:hypothetical protein
MQRFHVNRRGRRCALHLAVKDDGSLVEQLIAPAVDCAIA